MVRHADYPVSHFAALAAALSPAAAYCAQHQGIHLCQLPSHMPRAGVAQCASRIPALNPDLSPHQRPPLIILSLTLTITEIPYAPRATSSGAQAIAQMAPLH